MGLALSLLRRGGLHMMKIRSLLTSLLLLLRWLLQLVWSGRVVDRHSDFGSGSATDTQTFGHDSTAHGERRLLHNGILPYLGEELARLRCLATTWVLLDDLALLYGPLHLDSVVHLDADRR